MRAQVIAAGLIIAAAGLLHSAGDVPAILQRQTQELLDAVSSGSPSVWDRYVDPKAIYTDEEGAVFTKAQLVAQIKPLPPGVSGELKIINFQAAVIGDIAVDTYIAGEHELYHGQKLNSQYRTTDTWHKTSGGWRMIASQTIALRADPPAITLSPRQMAEYVGRYAADSTKVYEIRIQDGALQGQETGRPLEVLRAELPDLLFVPGKPRYRKIFQRASDGRIIGFAERREAWDLVWTRMP